MSSGNNAEHSTVCGWKSRLDRAHPGWSGYTVLLDGLPDTRFPTPTDLNRLCPVGAVGGGGQPLRFQAADELPGADYERTIFETGGVPTREENWHDLFNALVWCLLPQLKASLNAVHYRHLDDHGAGRRGRVRDALTLLDESGVIVSGPESSLLEALAARDWNRAFVTLRGTWRDVRVLVCGHAILEKLLSPYKALTAHALYLHAPEPLSTGRIDQLLAEALEAGDLMGSPRDLSPLPLMGIPAWWPNGGQDAAFYADSGVFRPPS
jgi:hypothetical protein